MIHMVGTGASISLSTDATEENFGPLIVGFASTPVTVTVRNNGGDAGLVTTNFSGMHPGDFGLVNDNCSGINLVGGGMCQLGLRFAPQAAGNRTATLVIDANGSTKVVTMTGTGATQQNPKFIASPQSLSFGDETVGATTPAQMVTITNHGATTSDTIAVSIGGSTASSFGATTGCTTLAPGASCTVMVTFKPQVTGGLSAPITVSAPGATPVTIVAAGNGI